jgi:DNA-binding IclR family transcriptional regulator
VKKPPTYSITSVDHALRIATMLQLEGELTVSAVAERLEVARSTAHRLLQTLVYRDFAVQNESRSYRPGPVLELAAHSRSLTSRLRSVAMPHLERLVAVSRESTNLGVRTGTSVRFIASVEGDQVLRVGSREGMVFPAHRTTIGLLMLSFLDDEQIESLFVKEHYAERPQDRPDLARIQTDVRRIRRNGFVVNNAWSERGVVAVGVAVRDSDGEPVAGLAISMPEVRYESGRLPDLVALLNAASRAITLDLAKDGGAGPR